MKKLLIFFAAGCLGALANSITVWAFGNYGLTKTLGVSLAPVLSSSWLYPRIVWGGIGGLLFILPMLDSKLLRKGSLLTLFPNAVQLFVVFPFKAGTGMAGLELGAFTPLLVLFFNWVWDIATAISRKLAK